MEIISVLIFLYKNLLRPIYIYKHREQILCMLSVFLLLLCFQFILLLFVYASASPLYVVVFIHISYVSLKKKTFILVSSFLVLA